MDAVLHMESKNYHHHHDSPLTSNGAATAGEKLGVERFELPRIYISLSRKEKEDDFLAMKGTKLPQRPKKRAKNVDKTLQVTPLQPPGLELDLILFLSHPISLLVVTKLYMCFPCCFYHAVRLPGDVVVRFDERPVRGAGEEMREEGINRKSFFYYVLP
jgi:hypothetical protein